MKRNKSSVVIGIDAHALGDKSGGNETYYRNLIENFTEEEAGNIILFVDNEFDTSNLKFSGQIVRFKSKNSFARNYIEIPYLMCKYRLSVMHMQYFIPFIRFCPVVTTIHDISFEHFKDIFTKKDYFLQKHLIPYAARRSKAIITVSEYSKKDICTRYGVNANHVKVTYNAPADQYRKMELTPEAKERIRTRYGIKEDYILSVGNLQPRKNIKRLLEAYIQFKKETQASIPLVIVGKKAWMYEDIFNHLEAGEIQNDIIFTGYVSDEDLIGIYNMASIFVYPSIFEGYGLPVAEAMACGVPVATSNVTAIPEVAGDACILFDPTEVDEIKSSINQLYSNLELRERCIQRGYVQVDKFNWKYSANETYQIYMSVCK